MSALLLFDIDGTLLLSGGAGKRAMTRAFEEVFGRPDAFSGILIAGRTDTFLVSLALVGAGLADTPEAHARFRDRYLELLPEEIRQPGTGPKGVMPGIRELLAQVSDGRTFYPALLTGNYEPAARIKLTHFGLDRFFSWGAFGEDSVDRDELARLAVARAEARAIPAEARNNTIVIGDTPHDIDCARAVNARVIAVATGGYSVEELRKSGADLVFEDLGDTAGVVARLRSL